MKANHPRPLPGKMPALRPNLLAMLLLAGCAGAPPPPPPAPPPAPVAPPRPAPRAAEPQDWRDAPLATGAWHWQRAGEASEARFTPDTPESPSTPQPALLVLRCDRPAGPIALLVPAPDAPPASTPVSMTIITSSQTRPLVATPTTGDGGMPVLRVIIPAHDPLLDAIAFSRGRWRIEAEGLAPLTVPSWPEVDRVIEDCR